MRLHARLFATALDESWAPPRSRTPSTYRSTHWKTIDTDDAWIWTADTRQVDAVGRPRWLETASEQKTGESCQVPLSLPVRVAFIGRGV